MHAVRIPPSAENWKDFGQGIFEIERSVFKDRALSEKMMESDLNHPDTVLVLLKDGESLAGFTYAVPESDGIARIVDTVIQEEHQHKGYVGLLMEHLEDDLRKQGYRFMTRDAMVDNGYADKIATHYSSRIVETRDLLGEWGRQRYFKIAL